MKRVVMIDMDLVCYVVAAGAETRKVEVKHTPTGVTKIFKHRTAFKEYMKERDKEVTEDYSVTDLQFSDSLENIQKAIANKVKNIVNVCDADEYQCVMGDSNNFRVTLPLPSLYKGSRSDTLRPLHLAEVREWAKNAYRCTWADGMETDDVITIMAYENKRKGNESVICSTDKDAKGSSGIYVYNWDNDTKPELISDLGSLYLSGKNDTVKGSGLLFLCYQWLAGDPTDCYKPSEASAFRLGSKGVYNLLKDCKSPAEAFLVVSDTYKKMFPEAFVYKAWTGAEIPADAIFMQEMYFKCAYMKRSWDDESDCWKFMEQYE